MLGTMQYMAPEVLMRRVPSYPADVYAYAIFGTFILFLVRAISMTSCSFGYFFGYFWLFLVIFILTPFLVKITAAETTTGVLPFADRARNVALAHTVLDMSYNEADLAKAIASEGLRPSLPTGTEEGSAASASALSGCVERCWVLDPNDRPAFVDVQKELDAIATAYLKSTGAPSLRRVWRPPSVARDAAHATADGGDGGPSSSRMGRREWVRTGSPSRDLPSPVPPAHQPPPRGQRRGVQHVRREGC
jgi:serine/threonine protein kinase